MVLLDWETGPVPKPTPKKRAKATYITPCGLGGVPIEFRDHCGRISCETCNCAVYDKDGRE
jgi:hypothetical protein